MTRLLFEDCAKPIPTLQALSGGDMSPLAAENLEASKLTGFGVPLEEWTSDASTHALRYSTHGAFRYFGKFPPTIARHLIESHTAAGELVIDPMVGSGTTAVEALLLERECVAMDVSPLSCLLTQAKTQHIGSEAAIRTLDQILCRFRKLSKERTDSRDAWPTEVDTDHFFLPETCHGLALLREAIDREANMPELQNLYRTVFASIVRRVSRATSEQGRLFLDADSAEADPLPRFIRAAKDAIGRVGSLPARDALVECHCGDCRKFDMQQYNCPLIICHPPYFNAYRYSRIFSLELAWLGFPVKELRKAEVREFFKVGKPENYPKYVEDMAAVLRNTSKALAPNGVLALMAGDTVLRNNRIPVIKTLIESVTDCLRPVRIAARIPKYTEASWAASQRRNGDQVGVRICDFVVTFERL